MLVGLWMQYFLDMFETVEEAVEAACPEAGAEEPFQVVVMPIVPGVETKLHVAFTDLSGDNVIMEVVEGKLRCHHSVNYTTMTNEPLFEQQLAINAYWEPIANFSMPGTARPAGKF